MRRVVVTVIAAALVIAADVAATFSATAAHGPKVHGVRTVRAHVTSTPYEGEPHLSLDSRGCRRSVAARGTQDRPVSRARCRSGWGIRCSRAAPRRSPSTRARPARRATRLGDWLAESHGPAREMPEPLARAEVSERQQDPAFGAGDHELNGQARNSAEDPVELVLRQWISQWALGRSIGRPAACQAGQPPATSAAPRHAVSFERLACWHR